MGRLVPRSELEPEPTIVDDIRALLQELLEDAGALALTVSDDAADRLRGARQLDRLVRDATSDLLRLARQEEASNLTWVGLRPPERPEA